MEGEDVLDENYGDQGNKSDALIINPSRSIIGEGGVIKTSLFRASMSK